MTDTTQSPEQQSVKRNIQAVPSIATWTAPWEGNINQPTPIPSEVEKSKLRESQQGSTEPEPKQ